MNYGKLITIEGISGMGKTFYFNELKNCYNKDDIIFNGEISDGSSNGINNKLFDILFSNNSRFFDNGNSKLETLLIAAKQVNDEKNFVIPSIQQGKTVISDRGFDTLCILEGIIMAKEYNLPQEECIFNLYNSLKTFCIVPNKTILLTGNEEDAINRAEERDKYKYTSKELEILKSSSYWFKKIASLYEERFEVINVDELSEKEIIKRIRKNI